MATTGTTDAQAAKRVVILGGGAAGVAAAYWLSAPRQQGRYQVTLYTQGWRLGGKCASGRNAAIGNRIEEHGLHMLMGCYQNAFATVRACWLDWRAVKKDPANPFQVWTDGFLPQRLVSIMEEDGPGAPPAWSPWNFPFFTLPGEPGDGPLVAGSDQDAVVSAGATLILKLADRLEAAIPTTASFWQVVHDALDAVRAVFLAAIPDTRGAQAALQKAAAQVQASFDEALSATTETAAGVAGGTTSTMSRLAILADLGLAIALGYLRDIFHQGPGAWDALDAQDFRAWLGQNGASAKTLASGPVNAFYDLTFAEIQGFARGLGSGSIAAGCALLAQMEMVLDYRNAPLWKMAAGMGDTVFTPFWDVLTARGVAVRLFSRVTALRPGEGGVLGEIDILTQAAIVGGGDYSPLSRVADLDCWPNQPLWDQLENGATLQAAGVNFESSFCTVGVGPPATLNAGVDFDLAILAMPPQALIAVAQPLVAASGAWSAALQASASVATQSLQLWMKPTTANLGWKYGATVLTAFEEPYDSWGDMSQVIGRETWTGPAVPGSIGYFCGCMPPVLGVPRNPPQMKGAAVMAADGWAVNNLATLWPLVGANPLNGTAVLGRYDVANFDISDTYVQTPAGQNVASRFDPATPAGFSNLYVVGDWTKTRFSGGCLESAIESAMLASRAISGFPQAIKTS